MGSSRSKEVTLVTMEVQGAFDAPFKRKLLHTMQIQGFHPNLLRLINFFLYDREIQVRLGAVTISTYRVECGIPQGSYLSPVLYMLYIALLMLQGLNLRLRFGYADDIAIYRASKSLDTNFILFAQDIRDITSYGCENKIFFAPEKLEMIHLSWERGNHTPDIVVNGELTVNPITISDASSSASTSIGNSRDNLTKTYKPSQSFMGKLIQTVYVPSLLHGCGACILTGSLRDIVHLAMNKMSRAVIPVWKTTHIATLCLDSGLPSIEKVGAMLPSISRPHIVPPHYSPCYQTNQIGERMKEKASDNFKKRWAALLAHEVTGRLAGYGYVIYQGRCQVASESEAINSFSYLFDAEVIKVSNPYTFILTTGPLSGASEATPLTFEGFTITHRQEYPRFVSALGIRPVT
ncbi:hypothetical protein BGHDH14_bgh04508 [Blumeria hordei DH14]|uniref:Reverse transcriptase domain-containing protein n=1 Tax=Blumeria graminis f. sp. hordei (strain DH14) TaxID=546991 RepID=N1J6S3_BLUG1|nr:hypothetical protein BGHDH14_bgh04508 [Blumeria hordei DH14]